MGRSELILPTDTLDTLEPLADSERGRLFTALLSYARTGEAPSLIGGERYVFPLIRAKIDRQRNDADFDANDADLMCIKKEREERRKERTKEKKKEEKEKNSLLSLLLLQNAMAQKNLRPIAIQRIAGFLFAIDSAGGSITRTWDTCR